MIGKSVRIMSIPLFGFRLPHLVRKYVRGRIAETVTRKYGTLLVWADMRSSFVAKCTCCRGVSNTVHSLLHDDPRVRISPAI